MNSIDFQFFIENDSNPFVLFSNAGKIVYLNNSAEILMGSCNHKELFKVTLSYAPKNFGYNKTAIELSFGSFEFYGINVLYENEEFIGIHLYNKPIAKIDDETLLEGYMLTNLNLLLQANIELFDIHYNGKIKLLTDYYIPELQIHQNNFSMLLRHIFSQFDNTKKLDITMKIKLGERIVVKEKRYSIISLQIKSHQRDNEQDKEIELLSLKNHINIHFKKSTTILEIPAIF
jgi:hypothetical protein